MSKYIKTFNNPILVDIIKQGGVGVLPTDTLYGVVCSAKNVDSVNRLYEVRSRDRDKPCIILIDNISRVNEFGVDIDNDDLAILNTIYPASLTVLLRHKFEPEFEYLYGQSKYLSFRVPKEHDLLDLLKYVGPLIAPSANPQGLNPALNIAQAMKYFGDRVDFYVDNGELNNPASTIATLENSQFNVIRQGNYKLDKSCLLR
jgi:L-threonylcarbamoyladenylate synthase